MFWLPQLFFAAVLGMVTYSGAKHARMNAEIRSIQHQVIDYPNGAAQYFKDAIREILATHALEIGHSPDMTVPKSVLLGAQSKKTGQRFFFFVVMAPHPETGALLNYFYYMVAPDQLHSAKSTFGYDPAKAHFPIVGARKMLSTRRVDEIVEWDALEDIDRFIKFQGDEILLSLGLPIQLGGTSPILIGSEDNLSEAEKKTIESLRRWTHAFRSDSLLFDLKTITETASNLKDDWYQDLQFRDPSQPPDSGDCGPLLH